MVLENILAPDKAESRPSILIFLGFLYTSIGLLLGYWIFKNYSSLFSVFLATIASIPIVYKVMKLEEQKDLTDTTEVFLLKEHSKALNVFMYLFLGATLAFTFWYVVLPVDVISIIFESQTSTLSTINPVSGKVVDSLGNVLSITNNATSGDVFKRIFFNNIKVLIFCVLFSFLYGAGAIFILIWNASVIGAAMGNFIRTQLALLAIKVGGASLGSYFTIISLGLFRYAIHGIPEILAYFVAALAGGIISIAIVNHEYSSRKFEHVVLDSADLLMLSIAILFIAALLEVYVTPVIFAS